MRSLVYAILVATATGCAPDPDPWCDDSSLPVASQLLVGLFDEDGSPLCATPTLLYASQYQPGRAERVGTSDFTPMNGYTTLDDAGKLVEHPGAHCNTWVTSTSFVSMTELASWAVCGPAMDVEVEVAGCDRASITWTWADNTYPGRFGINWYVPIVMTCAATP